MPWLIDSDLLIEGERENLAFVPWLALQAELPTKNTKDFKAMNCPCKNPLEHFPLQPAP